MIRLLVRLRYWKRRALAAEARCLEWAELYDAEMWRNRSREDMFVSATVMGSRAMFGVPPRTGPALKQRPTSLLEAAQPIMTPADRMEFEQYWLPDAERNGVTRQQAEKDFVRELANRKTLRDEPMM